ncbi:MAG: ImmA/IrrE family metallo-endopeptidase, partial [Pyrinomonadaceae bacterium]|nr:ImmA/IrrE family metallo-endopeptidase [Pyrinomonadaceae bacterium]
MCEKIFYILCESELVEVIEMPMKINGVCWYVQKQHVIAVNANLPYLTKLIAMWHEFGHFLMHFPNKVVGTYFWGDEQIYKGNRRQEKEADAFAYCAVIPKTWLRDKTFNDLIDEGFTDEQIWKRKEIYEQ